MSLQLLAQIDVKDGETTRKVSLYEGDLTWLTPDDRLDLLIVSAFPGDYLPTPSSLIGALARRGLSMAELAADKAHDLRRQCAFWLSHPLDGFSGLNIGRVACFESQLRGPPAALVGDLFRGLFPFLDPQKDAVVGMPLLATGDQGWVAVDMMSALVDAATHWMSRGLQISELKIVLRPSHQNQMLAEVFRKSSAGEAAPVTAKTDVFLSYSSVDADVAAQTEQALLRHPNVSEVFNFRSDIQVGQSWQREIDKAISEARAMVALISPDYLKSPECQEELMVARLRHKRAGPFLFPVWWRGADEDIALWLEVIRLADCREANLGHLRQSVSQMPL